MPSAIIHRCINKKVQETINKFQTKEELYNYMLLDKKRTNDYLQVIYVNEIGTFEIKKEPIENIKNYL